MKHLYNLKLRHIKILYFYVIVWLACFTIWCNPQNGLAQDFDQEIDYWYCTSFDIPLPHLPAIPAPEPITIQSGINVIYGGQEADELNFPIFVSEYSKYYCPFYDTLIIDPYIDVEEEFTIHSVPINDFSVYLNPKQTTEYTLTYKVTNDPYCDNVYIQKIKIEVFNVCNFTNLQMEEIWADYPWVDDLEETCLSSIEVYRRNNTDYLLFNYPKNVNLFFQDGSFICQNQPGYNCLEAYQLTNKVQSWSCDQQSTDNPIEEPVNVFNTYPFLTTFVDPMDCANKSVYVYDGGGYKFIIVKTDLAEILLTEDGKAYCTISSGGFSFIELYGASRILNQWSCDTGSQVRESASKFQNQGIQIFPNPAIDKLFINLQELAFEEAEISIYDLQGRQVKRTDSAEAFVGIVRMNIGDLEKGIYLVEVQTKDSIITEKLVIK